MCGCEKLMNEYRTVHLLLHLVMYSFTISWSRISPFLQFQQNASKCDSVIQCPTWTFSQGDSRPLAPPWDRRLCIVYNALINSLDEKPEFWLILDKWQLYCKTFSISILYDCSKTSLYSLYFTKKVNELKPYWYSSRYHWVSSVQQLFDHAVHDPCNDTTLWQF